MNETTSEKIGSYNATIILLPFCLPSTVFKRTVNMLTNEENREDPFDTS